MPKPQILVFIDWYTPGYKAGGPVRSMVNLVDHLRGRIDFHIVTSDTDYTEEQPYPGVATDRWTTMPGGEKVWYASEDGIRRSTWKKLLKEKQWDTVYINGIYSYWFSIMPLFLSTGKRRVVAIRGMLAEGPMQHGSIKKSYFITAMRMLGFYRNVDFQATNPEEVADIRKWIGEDTRTHLVPNLPRKLVPGGAPRREKVAGELRLVSVARIAVEKNTLFAIQCLKEVRGRVIFDLYGPVYDQPYWGECQKMIARLPPNVSVEHKGMIEPDRVPDVFHRYQALFMPSQGENFGHTMLEALCAALPLVISDRTPWHGLEAAKAGWDLPLAEPARFTSAIQRLVDMDPVEYAEWSSAAFGIGARYLNDPTPIEKSLALLTR